MAILAGRQTPLASRLRKAPREIEQRLDPVEFGQRNAVPGRRETARRRFSLFVDEQELLPRTAVRNGDGFITAAGLDAAKIRVASIEANAASGEPDPKLRNQALQPRGVLGQQAMRRKEFRAIAPAELVEGDPASFWLMSSSATS